MLNYIHPAPSHTPALSLFLLPEPHLVSMFCLMFAHFRLLVFGCKFIWLPRCFMLRFEVGPWLFYGTPAPLSLSFHFLFADNMFARIAATINCPGQVAEVSGRLCSFIYWNLIGQQLRSDEIPFRQRKNLSLNETRWLNCFRLTNWLNSSTQSWLYGQLFMAALIVVGHVNMQSVWRTPPLSPISLWLGCSLFCSAAINRSLNLI